jgi:hypothetical protein
MTGKRLAGYCHKCHAKHMRTHRPKHHELAPVERLKANARSYANVAQKRGRLARCPCERCGAEHAEKHHDDYSKPLEVRWLCRPCHLSIHRVGGF